jgi:hypothetical protein
MAMLSSSLCSIRDAASVMELGIAIVSLPLALPWANVAKIEKAVKAASQTATCSVYALCCSVKEMHFVRG